MFGYYPNIRVKLDEGAFMPERAHDTDAGADLFAPHDVVVPARGSVTVNTGVHVELPHGCAAEIVPKSGLNVKWSVVSFGLCDEGYTGAYRVKLYNLGGKDVSLPRGSKISQFVVQRVCYPTFEQVDEIEGGERGDAGFGSTNTITGGPRL